MFDIHNVYTVQQHNTEDMEALMVLAEEEYFEPQKLQNIGGILKVRTGKKDCMRIDTKDRQNRFAPEIQLTFKNHSIAEKLDEESKEPVLAGCSVTCYDCSLGIPLRTAEKQEKSLDKPQARDFAYNKHQTAFVKELLDRGVFSVATHLCKTCDKKYRTDLRQDIAKMCLPCAISHKCEDHDHEVAMITPPQFIQTMFKKAQALQTGMYLNCPDFSTHSGPQHLSAFEQIVREQLFELVASIEDRWST